MQRVNMGMMQMQMQQPCQKCGGKGKTHAHACPKCGGKRVVQENKKFEVDIARGMANNEKIVFEKQGEQVPDMIAGDLIFVLQQMTHNTYRRVQNNLYMNIDITLQQALLGYSKQFTHLDGHEYTLKSEPGQVS